MAQNSKAYNYYAFIRLMESIDFEYQDSKHNEVFKRRESHDTHTEITFHDQSQERLVTMTKVTIIQDKEYVSKADITEEELKVILLANTTLHA